MSDNQTDATPQMKYAGFWKRFCASFIDLIILAPLAVVSIWFGGMHRLYYVYSVLPSMLFTLWFSVYLVKRYGGTPGKLLLGIHITRVDGSRVGWREAFLRESVDFVTGQIMAFGLAYAVLSMTDGDYLALPRHEFLNLLKTEALDSIMPAWYRGLQLAQTLWFWSEFIVMLTNKKRRALHDYIAGTVVVFKPQT